MMKIAGVVSFLALAVAPTASGAPPDVIPCLGVQNELASSPSNRDPSRVDVGPLVLVLEGETSPGDSAYVVELLTDLLPEMTEVLGDPPIAELTVDFGGSAAYSCGFDRIMIPPPHDYPARGVDNDHDGAVDEDPYDGIDNDGDGRIDEDLANSPIWDATFAHELGHAFQDDVLCLAYPRWFTEGMAEAAAYLVQQRLDARGARHLLTSAFDLDLGVDDLHDLQGAAILGGPGRPIDRVSSDMAYSAAGATVLFPCLAEMAAGRDRPLARLTDALREDAPERALRYFDTVDRAFVMPVDGVLPPSRWMQSRSVVCPSIADGRFLAISYPELAVNPGRIGLMYFARFGFNIEFQRLTGQPVYTNAFGDRTAATQLTYVPALTPGAWRVRYTEPQDDGSTLVATSWVLRVHAGSVTFRTAQRTLGTAQVVPTRLRVVVFDVEAGPPRGVLTWSPYSPAPGGTFVACLDRRESSLAADPGPLQASLQTVPYSLQEADSMWTGPGDRVYARFTAPADMEYGLVAFQGADARHQSPTGGIRLRAGAEPRVIAVRTEPGFLTVTFDGPVIPAGLRVEAAPTAEGPWVASGDLVGDAGLPIAEVRFSIPASVEPTNRFARVVDTAVDPDGALCLVQLSQESAPATQVAYAPFPNPTDVGALWRVDLAAPVDAVLEVVDVAGGLVHGPERLRLDAGRNELWWDGRTAGRRAAAGVYFLRVTGPSLSLRTKIVLLPG